MHVFLSYDRSDSDVVLLLSSILRAHGVRPWIDTDSLPPGTPQWDRDIRNALQHSHAVIAVCSERSRDSHYVAIELEIAKGYGKRIFPVWIGGNDWSQSAPVSLVLSQHIDLRKRQSQKATVSDLIRALKEHLVRETGNATTDDDRWPLVRVEWSNKHIVLNPLAYRDWGELLSKVYLDLLRDHFQPFTYGATWALEISGSENPFGATGWPLFALPAKWAETPFRAVHEIDLDWVHSANLELTAVIDNDTASWAGRGSMRRSDFVRAAARIIDLNSLAHISRENLRYERRWDELDTKENFIGINCRFRTFGSFAVGAHPKMIVMSLSRSGRTTDVCEEASEYFSLTEPRFQAVTFATEYFAQGLTGQLSAVLTKPTRNVIEFA